MARFQDIPQLTPFSGYAVDVGWDFLPIQFTQHVEKYQLNVCPDFQRGYVWNEKQKVRYVEYVLSGGQSGRDLYFNAPNWHHGNVGAEYKNGWYVLVDGKQRLDAVLGFLNNEFPVFGGNFRRDYTDRIGITHARFRWHVNTLKTYDECLQWYIDLNTGGTVHSEEEISRVRGLIGKKIVLPTTEEIVQLANLDREILRATLDEERKSRAEQLATLEKVREAEAAKKTRGRKQKVK